MLRVLEPRRVAEAIEAFLVEHLRVLLGHVEIAAHHHRPLDAHFHLGAHRRKLQRRSRQRHSDHADTLENPVRHRHALRLGGAIHGQQRNTHTGGLNRQLLDALVHVVRQSRAAIDERPHAREHRVAQLGISLHRFGQHAERDRRRAERLRPHVLQVRDRRLEQAGHRPALVDVEGSAQRQHVVEVHIAARDMAPGHPVERLLNFVVRFGFDGRARRDLRRHLSLALRRRFGHAGGARREQVFADRIRPQPLHRRIDERRRLRLRKLRKGFRPFRSIRRNHRHARQVENRQRLAERVHRLHEDRLRLHRRKAVLQLGEVRRHDRVRLRDRRRWRADALRRQAHQRMLDRIARQDQQWRIGPQSAIQQRLCDGARDPRSVAIRHFPPRPMIGRALLQPRPVRMGGRALIKNVGDGPRLRRHRCARPEIDDAARPARHLDVGRLVGQRLERGLAGCICGHRHSSGRFLVYGTLTIMTRTSKRGAAPAPASFLLNSQQDVRESARRTFAVSEVVTSRTANATEPD